MIISAPRPTTIQGSSRSPYATKTGAFGIATFAHTWNGWTTVFASEWTNPDTTITPDGFIIPGNSSYAWRDDGRVVRRLQWQMRSTVLGDVFFGCDASGAGTMFRLDTRGPNNYTGFGTTTKWTAWDAPKAGFNAQPNMWYTITLDLTNTTAQVVIIGNNGGGDLDIPLYTAWLRIRTTRRWRRRRNYHSSFDRVHLTPLRRVA